MANRLGDFELRFAQVSAHPVNTLAWLGFEWAELVWAQNPDNQPTKFYTSHS